MLIFLFQLTLIRRHKQVSILPLEDVICPVLLQLLVELQADAHVYFGFVFFGIRYPNGKEIINTTVNNNMLNLHLRMFTTLPVKYTIKICYSDQNALRLLFAQGIPE